ncbi:MAG: 3-phosphoshikimate 1-carboxyvinyltransferase, partial [Bacteroidaceae bacterium]|nr:3-phosphoshikimate 1-carboxyvinyltransferase [Bacteroidaceae bacterium]
VMSRPYIDMTTSLMRRFGITVEEPDDRTFRVLPGEYTGGEYLIENDWSAASYWYEMLALADDGEIVLEGLFADSLQGDSCVQQLFEPLGIETTFCEKGAVIRKRGKGQETRDMSQRYEADLSRCPDLAQTMVATCCGMGVPFHFSGLQTLRIKETDRLLALQQELGKLGYEVEEENGSVLKSGARSEKETNRISSDSKCIDTYSDHRMAMCMAPLAMLHEGLVIKDAQVVSKSYPTFWEDIEKINVQ